MWCFLIQVNFNQYASFRNWMHVCLMKVFLCLVELEVESKTVATAFKIHLVQ